MYNIILNNISKQERQKLIDDVNQILEFAAKNKKIRPQKHTAGKKA